MVCEWDTSHYQWVVSYYGYLKDTFVSSADDWAVYMAVGVSYFFFASCRVGLGQAPVVLCALLSLAALADVVGAWPAIVLLYGPRLGLSKYISSSFLCLFFALAALAALGGALGVCYWLAAPPSSGFTCGGYCPVRVCRWDYQRHSPVSSLGPLCLESMNLSTLVGLSCG